MREQWREDFELMIEAVALGASKFGLSLTAEQARTQIIIHWMRNGRFEPFAEAVAEGRILDPIVGKELMSLVVAGRLRVAQKPGIRGAKKRVELLARQARMFLAYDAECARPCPSNDAFERVAKEFGVSVESVRAAVTQGRKLAQATAAPK